MIRTLLVDDHPAFLRGVAEVTRDIGVTVVGEATTGEAAIERYRDLRPQLVILDLRLPSMGGAECVVELLRIDPAARILIFTTYKSDPDLWRAIQAGAAGCLLKDCAIEQLCEAIQTVAGGRPWIDPSLNRRFEELKQTPVLSPRELEILSVLVSGKSNKEAARRLFISEDTVKSHLKSIFRKLSAQDRTEAVVEAMRLGLVRLPE
jgi:DNA-binding NarL/FixJ family response regulator